MTNIDVIEMAREIADPDKVDHWRNGFWVLTQEERERLIARLASLVRADAIAEEREACAKLIEDYKYWLGRTAKEDIAAAIRARGATNDL